MRIDMRWTRVVWAGWMLSLAGCGASQATDASTSDVAMANDVAAHDATDVDFTDAIADVIDAAIVQDVTDVASASDVVDAAAYPAGPYGNQVGQVLANLNWVGYVNTDGAMVSTALPYGPTSLDALRQGHHYGLVHISEFY